jgi:Tfp pilus assembly protein PilF
VGHHDTGDTELVAEMLDQAVALDKKYVDAYLSRAGIYGQIKNYTKAIENYELAFMLDSVYSHDYKLPYSINLAGLGEFEKALSGNSGEFNG